MSEGVSDDAARRIADMKKPDMAQTAEQLLTGSGWLPTVLRTPNAEEEQPAPVETEDVGSGEQPSEAEAPYTEAEDCEESFAVAAE